MSIVIIRAALITEKYFQFSRHMCIITSTWSSNVWIKALKILHRMSKYIYFWNLNRSLIQKTLKNFYNEWPLWKHCPKVLKAQYSDSIVEVGPYFGGGVSMYILAVVQATRSVRPISAMYIPASVTVYLCPSIHLSIHPYIHPFIHPSTHPSIHPSIHSSTYLW